MPLKGLDRSCVVVATAAFVLGGCGGQPPIPEISRLDVDGHSGAFGTGALRPGPHGTGVSSQLARALDLAEKNNAEVGATLQESGVGTDGWGKVLSSNPRPPQEPAEALPRMALLWYGGNDVAAFGSDLSRAKEAYRVIVSRHRSSVVYEAGSRNDRSITPDDAWEPMDTDPGEASGQSLLVATGPGKVTIEIPRGELAEGSAVALGFVQQVDTSARYTVEVDGKRAGALDASAPLTPEPRPYVPEHDAAGYVFRIEDLPAGRHTIEVTADPVNGQATFDYWQVEPPKAQPVILVNQYLYPSKGKDPPVPNRQLLAVNEMIDAVAGEFGARVIAVDADRAVNRSRALISPDGVHPNQHGHDLITEAILNAIEAAPFAGELGRGGG